MYDHLGTATTPEGKDLMSQKLRRTIKLSKIQGKGKFRRCRKMTSTVESVKDSLLFSIASDLFDFMKNIVYNFGAHLLNAVTLSNVSACQIAKE